MKEQLIPIFIILTFAVQVEELVSLSLNHPVRIFIDQNTDVATCLQQEFIRIRENRENDRLAIVTGNYFLILYNMHGYV